MTRPIPGGFLVAIEGIDGSGKTTQAKMLAAFCKACDLESSESKEPTRGQFGQILRDSALTGRLTVEEELDLFLKDRREHVETKILPALKRDEVVILDRYYYSTAAYQGARGADPVLIIKQNEEFAPKPDLIVLLDVPAVLGLQRIRQRGDVPNKFEDENSLEHARQIFNDVQSSALVKLDATRSIEILHGEVRKFFQIRATNKISAAELSPGSLNRTLELLGGKAMPIPA